MKKQNFVKWAESHPDFAEVTRVDEDGTLVIIRGLNNCSEAMEVLQKSEEHDPDNYRIMDMAFRNYKLAVAIASRGKKLL